MTLRTLAALITGVLLFPTANFAAFLDPELPGTTSYDGWSDLTSTDFPGYGGFPGTSAWPAPIGSNDPDSGNATLMKVSGNGYPAIESIYSPFYAAGQNYSGIYSVNDDVSFSDLATVIFQLEIGSGTNGETVVDGPILTLNGGATSISANFFQVVSAIDGGEGPLGDDFIIYTLAWQWNLTDVSEPITSFSINWSVGEHTQMYALQLNSGNTFAQVVPEPSSMALLVGALGVGGFFVVRRRLHSLS